MQPDYDYIEQLMVQKLSGSLSVEEDVWLLQCIQEDEKAALLWQQTQQAMAVFEAGEQVKQLDMDKAWHNIAAGIDVEEEAPVVTMHQPTRWWRSWQAAACVLVLVLSGWWIWQWAGAEKKYIAVAAPAVTLQLANGKTITLAAGNQQLQAQVQPAGIRLQDGTIVADAAKDKIDAYALNTLNIPDGEEYHLVLPDGTEVWLNAATSLQFPLAFTGEQRLVKVSGEAYFKVAPDAAHTFVVNANGTAIKVLGTEFNTRCYPGEPAATALVSGKVAVEMTGKQAFRLQPGEQVRQNEKKEWEVAPFDEAMTLSWLKGLYLFNNEPLQQLKHTIERWYGVQVRIEPALAARRFSGAMEKGKSIEVFLKNLTATSSIHYTVRDRIIHIF